MKQSANQCARTGNRSKVDWKLLNEEIGRGKKHTELSSPKVGSSVLSARKTFP